MTSSDGTPPPNKLHLYLAISIPAVSFGGILVAIALQQGGQIPDAGKFAWGCIAGSILLAYLAYIKPRRDIVSLCAPLYALLMFIAPLEIQPNLILQALFAASLTILAVRLQLRFSTPPPDEGDEDPMIPFLDQYIERIRPLYRDMKSGTAHEIATAVLSFKFGLHNMAASAADTAAHEMGETEPEQVLKKALMIVHDRATNLENADVSTHTNISFDPSEEAYLAIVLPPERVEDPDTLKIDNALLLLYAVAYTTSPEDEQALDEHQNYVIQIIQNYKDALKL
jgi:hypothetical protein